MAVSPEQIIFVNSKTSGAHRIKAHYMKTLCPLFSPHTSQFYLLPLTCAPMPLLSLWWKHRACTYSPGREQDAAGCHISGLEWSVLVLKAQPGRGPPQKCFHRNPTFGSWFSLPTLLRQGLSWCFHAVPCRPCGLWVAHRSAHLTVGLRSLQTHASTARFLFEIVI